MNEVKIDVKSIPDVDMRIGCKILKGCIERMLADPKKRAEFEAWAKEREGVKSE